MSKLKELRCAVCGQKLAEYDFPEGQIGIICFRSRCKTLNVVIVRKELSENSIINVAQNQTYAI